MEVPIYETYNYHTKRWYWWTGRDKSTNCFEIRHADGAYSLLRNEIFVAKYDDFISAEKALKAMYDGGGAVCEFRVLRR